MVGSTERYFKLRKTMNLANVYESLPHAYMDNSYN